MQTPDQPSISDNLPDELHRWRVVIVLHYYATGPGQELHDWLQARGVAESFLVEHPFPFSRRDYSRSQRVQAGSPPAESRLPRRPLPMFIRYGLDLLRTLRLVWRTGALYDYYVGNGSFDTLAGIALRAAGRVRRVILYTIDYAPMAGGSRLYHWLYRLIDRFCCRHADVIWNLSTRLQEARIADGMRPDRSAPALRVPHGTHSRALRSRLPDRPDPCRVGFLGHVLEKSGVQLFLEAMPRLRQRFPDLRLEVIGDGPYRPALEELTGRLGLQDAVTFHGFVPSHEDAERLLMRCSVGLALYWPEVDDYSRHTDQGKPKIYLGCGLPVIIVKLPEVADEIAARRAGVAIGYDGAELERAVAAVLEAPEEYRANARTMGEDYDWDSVFTRAWTETRRVLAGMPPATDR